MADKARFSYLHTTFKPNIVPGMRWKTNIVGGAAFHTAPRRFLPSRAPGTSQMCTKDGAWHAVLWKTSMVSKGRIIVIAQVCSRKGHRSLRLRGWGRFDALDVHRENPSTAPV